MENIHEAKLLQPITAYVESRDIIYLFIYLFIYLLLRQMAAIHIQNSNIHTKQLYKN